MDCVHYSTFAAVLFDKVESSEEGFWLLEEEEEEEEDA